MTTPALRARITEGERHLAACDEKLATLIARFGPCTLGTKRRDPFHVLCAAIIGQQLSTKAADTIQARVATAVLAGARFMPAHFIDAEFELLRAAGLSNAKSKWLVALAQAVHRGELDFGELRRLDEEAAIERLDALPGIGRWTAEMFLIFAMNRLDLFSLGDVGLRRGVDQLYGRPLKPLKNGRPRFRPLDDKATSKITARWAPYRSIASWYLWRIADGDAGVWT